MAETRRGCPPVELRDPSAAGDMLQLQLQHNASNLTHSLDSHLSSVAAAVASGSDAVAALATQGSEKAGAGACRSLAPEREQGTAIDGMLR